MKTVKLIGIFASMAALLFFVAHFIYFYSFRPTETFPADKYLNTVSNKKALVLVAHDDESAVFGGTLTKLIKEGWQIDFMCTYVGEKTPLEELRKGEATKAAQVIGFNQVHLIDFDFIRDIKPGNKSYMPIPYADFENYFMMDSLRSIITDRILESQPTVIFTLDDVIGGYGNPEHVVVGQVAKEMSIKLNNSGKTKIEKIYQFVYPKSQEFKINNPHPVYHAAKRIYQVEGMPAPDVEINISEYSSQKMSAIRSYPSQHNSLSKFVIFYHIYPHWIYFKVFNREFFKVVTLA